MMAYNAIARHVLTRVVRINSGVSYVDGERISGLGANSSLDLAVLPVTAQQLHYLPPGSFTTQDVNVYEIGGTLTLTEGSEVDWRGSKYIVREIKDWREQDNYVRYIAKRKALEAAA